ncbi:MAG: glycosyltransferase family 2 protein [Candidatus Eremiobacteraeota bacterium]|nr:glycosyltransferase family 2 protein [Candidatus Eremiobacteraeota bacterium]
MEPATRVSVVIPALNEEASIGKVIAELPAGIFEIIVADNGSTDGTARRARQAGARVVSEPISGYGRACTAGARAVSEGTQILAFLDGDGSDDAAFLPNLLEPILSGNYDFVIGSRVRGEREAGSMSVAQLLAGKIAGIIMELLYGVRYTDMCPFRAIRYDEFLALDMSERTYGWNVEMQMKAALRGLRILELPVSHRLRSGGVSKVSGSLKGTVLAGTGILQTIARIAWNAHRTKQPRLETAD